MAATPIPNSIAQVISAQARQRRRRSGRTCSISPSGAGTIGYVASTATRSRRNSPPTSPPTGVPFCDRFPLSRVLLVGYVDSAPTDGCTTDSNTTYTTASGHEALLDPRYTIAPAPTNTPRAPITAAPAPTRTPRPNSTNTSRPPASTPTQNPGGGRGGGDSGGGGGAFPTNTPVPPSDRNDSSSRAALRSRGQPHCVRLSLTMVKKNRHPRWINRIQTCYVQDRGVRSHWSERSPLNPTLPETAALTEFDLVGNHRITIGNESINFGNSTSVQEGG